MQIFLVKWIELILLITSSEISICSSRPNQHVMERFSENVFKMSLYFYLFYKNYCFRWLRFSNRKYMIYTSENILF